MTTSRVEHHHQQRQQHQQPSSSSSWEQVIRQLLDRRRQLGTLRQPLPMEQLTVNNNHCSASAATTSSSSCCCLSPESSSSSTINQQQEMFRHVDFSSNDYLGLAHCPFQQRRVQQEFDNYDTTGNTMVKGEKEGGSTTPNNNNILGATGSRLLSGDSYYARHLEQRLAKVHHRTATVLFNSGYDANLSVLSSLPAAATVVAAVRQPEEKNHRTTNSSTTNYNTTATNTNNNTTKTRVVVLIDELVHNSIQMGIRASRISDPKNHHVITFQHNHVQDLHQKLIQLQLKQPTTTTTSSETSVSTTTLSSSSNSSLLLLPLIVVESVYSMDGDIAPLQDILQLALQYNAMVVVDEAHGLGVYGCTNVSDLYLPRDDDNNNDNNNDPCDGDSMDGHDDYDTAAMNTKRNHQEGTTAFFSTAAASAGRSIGAGAGGAGGMGVLAALQLENHPALLCSIHTFGKAAGCHGAIVATSHPWYALFLWNFAMPLVYSTALPLHSLVTISCAYDTMMMTTASMAPPHDCGGTGDERRRHLFALVRLFRKEMNRALTRKHHQQQEQQKQQQQQGDEDLLQQQNGASQGATKVQVSLWPSPSPIQALRITLVLSSPSSETSTISSLPCASANTTSATSTTTTSFRNGNECVVQYCSYLYQTYQLRLYPIRAPTVPMGTERVRILLHAHNTKKQVRDLVCVLMNALDHVFPNHMWQAVPSSTSTSTTTPAQQQQHFDTTWPPSSRL